MASLRDVALNVPLRVRFLSDSGPLPISILVRHDPVLGNASICEACCVLTGLGLAELLQMCPLEWPLD